MAKNKGGRPKKDIDYETVEKLASMMCTQEEIGNYLDISPRTLQRDKEFCRVYKKGIDKGKMSVRRQQYQSAQAGNVPMQIWLGKNYLNQSDKTDEEREKIKIDKEYTKAKLNAINSASESSEVADALRSLADGIDKETE